MELRLSVNEGGDDFYFGIFCFDLFKYLKYFLLIIFI